MANEFKHKTVGTVLTQAEWEATDGTSHQLDSQATGDIIYASSSTVLSRLGIGSTNGFLVVASGLPAWDTSPTVTDDLTFNLGTGNDVVLLNRSSILNANTALSNVMIGTPVTPAVAANSLLVSNVTASGDYLLALNNGGNSQAWHWVDSSAGTQTLYAAGVQRILLNSTGGSFTGTWSDLGTVTTVDINGGSIDGAAIGAASHSTIKGTTVDATTDFTIGSTVITDDKVAYGAAGVFQMVAATEDALKFTDGTNDLMRFNTKVDTDRMNFLDVGTPGAAVSFAAASNSSFRLFRLLNYTITLTGDAANPAAMEGLMLYSGIPTLTDSTAVTVTKASSIYIQAPVEAGSVTLTGAMALHIADAGGTPTNQYGIYIDALTAGATADYAIYTNAGLVRFGDAVTAANGITSTAASNTLGATSFNDADITNVGDISLDSISSDGAANISLAPHASFDVAITTGLIIGNTTKMTSPNTAELQVLGTADPDSSIMIGRFSADANGATIYMVKGRDGIGTTTTKLADDDEIGSIEWMGVDAVDNDFYNHAAAIRVKVDGDPTDAGDDDMPARMEFYTTPNDSATPALRMGIGADGHVGIGTATNTQYHFVVGGDMTGSGNSHVGSFQGTMAMSANSSNNILFVAGTLAEFSGSSTHALLTGIHVDVAATNDGTATTTNSAAVYIKEPITGVTPTGAAYALWVDTGTSRFDGDIDMNGTGDLLNVGAAGNDWTTDAFIQNGGTNAQSITVLTNGTTGTSSTLRTAIAASSSGSCMVSFKQGSGNGSANNMSYTMAYRGASEYFHLQSADYNGGAGTGSEADIFRVPDGQASIDANTTWDENVFDDYDDVALLEAAIRPTADAYDFGQGILKRGREALIEVGVLRRYDDGFVGYNDQRMAALICGAIYQQHDVINGLEERLAALEAQGG